MNSNSFNEKKIIEKSLFFRASFVHISVYGENGYGEYIGPAASNFILEYLVAIRF